MPANTHPLIQALQELTGDNSPLALEHLVIGARHITKERERELSAASLKEKKELLSEWFHDYLTKEVKNTLALLAEEHALDAARNERAEEETEEIRFTTAKKLSEETKSWIRKEMGEGRVGTPIVFREDPALFGGIKIKAGDKEVEYSMRQRLARI
ncbi:MAG: F0F1 ATP synthase subunit delta [Patescibacteria group bacterium]